MSATSVLHGTPTLAGRKRKCGQTSLVIYCSADDTSNAGDDGPDMTADDDGDASAIESPTTPKAPRPKRYKCTYEGCIKAYTKPSRLDEHVRSHTGERPFKCESCGKAYLRESHLTAHARTHLDASEKKFGCGVDECGKSFWTAQQLKVHEQVHQGVKPFACTVEECGAEFAKHHQLRAHVAEAHCPPGTKPFRCEHADCEKSFRTNQKLTAHSKTHLERRYACMHPSCATASEVPVFSKWTQLQHHMRTSHPPACPRLECNGRTFANAGNLKAHLVLHDQRDAENEIEEEKADEGGERPAKRRRGGEIGRDWVCMMVNCEKAFKSKKALQTHEKVSHLGLRNFVCDHDDCGKSFGYKHLLQRHALKIHTEHASSSDSDAIEISDAESVNVPNVIDVITGKAYLERKGVHRQPLVQCPWPTHFCSLMDSSTNARRVCRASFTRAYDLRRHLRAEHGEEQTKEDVDVWVRARKKEMAATAES